MTKHKSLTITELAGNLEVRATGLGLFGLSKTQTNGLVTGLLDDIKAGLATGRRVKLHEFGSFKVTDRKARMGYNIKTGEAIPIPARRVVKFKFLGELPPTP